MTRAWNFCAGPAALPETVLARAAEEMLDWHGKGLSFMEMSHRERAVSITPCNVEWGKSTSTAALPTSSHAPPPRASNNVVSPLVVACSFSI